jgi:phospholipase C
MAILIAWDDSDGWYDHVLAPIVNPSDDVNNDAILGPAGLCGTAKTGAYLDRCVYGPRLPFLVVSPFAKENFVAHTVADQSSITKFIEDNWQLGQIGDQSFDAMAGSLLNLFDFNNYGGGFDRKLVLNPNTGERQVEW